MAFSLQSADLQSGMISIHQLISSSLSVNKLERQQCKSLYNILTLTIATKQLDDMKLDEPTTTILLQYIQNGQFDENSRSVAAILLKNKIKLIYGQHSYTHYEERRPMNNAGEDGEDISHLIDDKAVALLQDHLVTLMISSPKMIADQFLEVISLMAKRFIHIVWPNLVPVSYSSQYQKELINHLQQSQDPLVIKYVLEAFKKICKKYRYMFRSDALYIEINYMIENLSVQLLTQANNCVSLIKEQQGMPQQNYDLIQTAFSILNSILNVIESFLAQEELPDFYEENLETIASIMSFILVDTSSFQDKNGNAPIELIKCRAKVVRVVHAYQFKFGEHFQQYSQYFFDKIWAMVSSNQVPSNKNNEKLIHAILRYFTEMSSYPELQEFFKTNMLPLFQLIAIPNIAITEDDLEEYEMEPEQYIRNDLEESDTDTRRRQCMKFVQSLSKRFPNEITQIISNYVTQLLGEYEQNRNQEWMKKTTVLNLIITASITQYTYRHGAENILIPFEALEQYLQHLVLPELQEQNLDNLSLLKATCIKFIYMFRNQIPDQLVPQFVNKVADFLKSESPVNQSYAAACIEKLLVRRSSLQQPDGSYALIFNSNSIDQNLVSKLLQNLCELLQVNKNLYGIRSLYRTVQLANSNMSEYGEQLGIVLGQFIGLAAKDESQSSPNYLYILFETTALTLKLSKNNAAVFDKIESYLVEPLNYIISVNITDMISYAFQIYAIFVANSQSGLNNNYKVITESIFTNIGNWGKDMKYLIPSMTQFLISMIFKNPDHVKQYSQATFDIIIHLIDTDTRMEQSSLQIASAVFEKLGIPSEQFLHDYLMKVFQCLHFYKNNTKAKVIPVPIMKAVWAFFANFMIYNGVQSLLNACDKIQRDILLMILKSEGEKVKYVTNPPRDRKYTIVAFSQLIQETMNYIPDDVLAILSRSLVDLCFSTNTSQSGFQIASTLSTDTEDLLLDGAIDQTFAFQRSSYVQLNAARIEQSDKLLTQIPSPERFALEVMQEIERAKNVGMSVILSEEKQRNQMSQLCQHFQIQLN